MKSYKRLEDEMIDIIDTILDRFNINKEDIIDVVKDRISPIP